ncbi:MarR family winged helix-turn-helix transcriptional regulator [Chthonobacter rhizosphaerae]|uniref:MarR family winged helix-turn-helix transcriptional regulator n=1 Tax=Chthonobacter rhizosphaerae TaxID=2735553 RepID=UPI0015EEA9B4|nr:MarR family transcriptional regulator [Chthonobacter rhizosphaerae]
MADVNVAQRPRLVEKAPRAAGPASPEGAGAALDFELIELMFFAYRDFVAEADETLAEFGFGRAHHRVLHFVNRQPGLRVTDLLDTLRITKQSLGRVLKQLVDDGYIEQTPGAVDRRERLLAPTEKGRRLALDLAARQHARIAAALAPLGPEGRDAVRAFLAGMVDETPRPPRDVET